MLRLDLVVRENRILNGTELCVPRRLVIQDCGVCVCVHVHLCACMCVRTWGSVFDGLFVLTLRSTRRGRSGTSKA